MIYSPSLFTETAPYVAMLVDGQRISLRGLISLKIKEAENKKATLSFRMTDYDDYAESGVFALNRSVVVHIGYATAFEERGPFTIDKSESSFTSRDLTIAVSAMEGSAFEASAQRRVFTTGTIRSVFESLCSDLGYELVVATGGDFDGSVLDYPVTSDTAIVQSNTTALATMKRIANDYGWSLSVTNGKVHLTPPSYRPVLDPITLRYNVGLDSELMSVSLTYDKPRTYYEPPKEPKSKASDEGGTSQLSGKPTETASEKEEDTEPARRPAPVVQIDEFGVVTEQPVDDLDGVFNDGTVFEDDEGVSEPSVPVGAESESNTGRARERVKRRKLRRQGKLKSVKIKLKVGAVMFRPQHKLILEGCRFADGEYRVTLVEHDISANGFSSSLECASGFTAPKRKGRTSDKTDPATKDDNGAVDPLDAIFNDGTVFEDDPEPTVTINEFGEVVQ